MSETRLICGEHGKPLFYDNGDVFCEHPDCDKSWSDLYAEVGERIMLHKSGEVHDGVRGPAEVWVVTRHA